MNYNDYYTRKAGGALPYFVSARGQRGHGFGSLFGGLIRSAMPLIKRGAVALGKGALKTGLRIADDVMSGQNIKNGRQTTRHLHQQRLDTVSVYDSWHANPETYKTRDGTATGQCCEKTS